MFLFSGALLSSAMIFFWVIILYKIVVEKMKMLRYRMAIMGMSHSIYWISWFIDSFVLMQITVLILIGCGYAFRLEIFTKSEFSVFWVIFSAYGIYLISFAFLLSTLVSTARAACMLIYEKLIMVVIVSFIVNAIAFVVNFAVTNPQLLGLLYAKYKHYMDSYAIFYPSYNFGKES